MRILQFFTVFPLFDGIIMLYFGTSFSFGNKLINSLIYYINYKNLNSIKFTYTFLFLNFVFILGAYILISLDAEYTVRTTMDRLIFSTSGFYLISIIHFINFYKNDLKIKFE